MSAADDVAEALEGIREIRDLLIGSTATPDTPGLLEQVRLLRAAEERRAGAERRMFWIVVASAITLAGNIALFLLTMVAQ